jgi:hypothetical protein
LVDEERYVLQGAMSTNQDLGFERWKAPIAPTLSVYVKGGNHTNEVRNFVL